MHPLKRRKLDQGRVNFTKPFRSPFRAAAAQTPTQSGANSQRSEKTTHTPDILEHGTARSHDGQPTKAAAPSRRAPSASPIQTDDVSMTGSIDLQKDYAALSRQLTLLRESLAMAEQALQIATGKQQRQTEALLNKWKLAVRTAADELFEHVKDNTQYQPPEAAELSASDLPLWMEEEREELTEEQLAVLELQEEDARAEAERYRLLKQTESDGGQENQTFTMDMMLQQMNIDLTVVGYDTDSQCWKE